MRGVRPLLPTRLEQLQGTTALQQVVQ
jgi:hypothetical protein